MKRLLGTKFRRVNLFFFIFILLGYAPVCPDLPDDFIPNISISRFLPPNLATLNLGLPFFQRHIHWYCKHV